MAYANFRHIWTQSYVDEVEDEDQETKINRLADEVATYARTQHLEGEVQESTQVITPRAVAVLRLGKR